MPAGASPNISAVWQAGELVLHSSTVQLVGEAINWRMQRAALLAAAGEPSLHGNAAAMIKSGKQMLCKSTEDEEGELALIARFARCTALETTGTIAHQLLPSHVSTMAESAQKSALGDKGRVGIEASLGCLLETTMTGKLCIVRVRDH